MDAYKLAKNWFAAVMIILVGSLIFLGVGMSYFPFIWVAVGVIILYKARFQSPKTLSLPVRAIAVLLGFVACFYSLSSPYFRMPEVTILLAGLSVVFFAAFNSRRPIIPLLIPILVAFASRNIRPMLESVIQPLVRLTFVIVSSIFGLFIEIQTRGNVLSFKSVNDAFMNIGIDNSCSGIWSLGAFTIAMLLVLVVFPHFYRIWIKFFAIGFAVTYALNILRILLVCLVGYLTGSYDTVMFAHTHIGWILFTVWMVIFWYYFISALMTEKKSQEKDGP